MSINTATLEKIVVDSGLITAKNFDDLLANSKKKGVSIEQALLDAGVLDQNRLLEIKGNLLGVSVVDIKHQKISKEVLSLIPEPIARKHNVIAFSKEDNKLHLAMTDPDDLQIIEFIKKTTGLQVSPFLTTKENIDFGLSLYHSNIEEEFKKIMGGESLETQTLGVAAGPNANEKLAAIAEQVPVVRIVDTLLEYAVYEKASDIHIEPQDNKVVARYRIDGILHDVMSLPKVILPAVVARIKVLSNLKIDEHRLPQDGRFKKDIGGSTVAFRVSTIPVFDGEKVVMRLLEEGIKALSLQDLGVSGRALDIVMRNIKKPHGTILVTGPTGSGKSTTLYSVLTMLNSRDVNISTIEDPVEYRIPGINQMQVLPKIGLTFAIGLRALLRQDPNIIMIGEIRDRETAEEAVHAAMTGHLVLSTLHTNSASGALPRLLDMGVEPFLIASTVNVIVAQRLVRKLCKNCMVSYNLTDEQIRELSKQFNLDELLKIMIREGIVLEKVKSIKEILFFKGQGCEKCSSTGYKSRQGIYEVVEVSEKIGQLIMKRASAGDIQTQAVNEGSVLLWQDGFVKAHLGVTSIEEILRVSKE